MKNHFKKHTENLKNETNECVGDDVIDKDNVNEEQQEEPIEEDKDTSKGELSKLVKIREKLNEKTKQLEEKTKQSDEYLAMLQRTTAEFDNYKKRTAREKDAIYNDTVGDVLVDFLPVIDNFERAIISSEKDEDFKILKNGIEMLLRQMKDVIKKFGVEEIDCINANFDPNLHNAVMHIEDQNFGENVVVEELQKGYALKEKVIRHSMVKVAN